MSNTDNTTNGIIIPKNRYIDHSTENKCKTALLEYFREHYADVEDNPISARLYEMLSGPDLEDESKEALTQIFIKSPPPEKCRVSDEDCLLIENARDLMVKQIVKPAELIHGILYQGGKMSLNAPSKMGKTWSLVHLGISLNAGLDWFGFPTTMTRVLFINPELQAFSLEDRIQKIARGLNVTLENFNYITTRGKELSSTQLLPRLERKVKSGDFGAIILDSIYKLYPDEAEENSNSDIGRFLSGLDKLADRTGAAIIYSHHYSKGNQANKAAMDRSSGAGVWSRDPDAIISITEHEKENCYGVEFNLRDFKPVAPIAIRVAWPDVYKDSSLNPKALKTTKFEAKYDKTDILKLLSAKSYAATELQKELEDDRGMSSGYFYKLWPGVKKTEGVTQDKDKRWSYISPASNPANN